MNDFQNFLGRYNYLHFDHCNNYISDDIEMVKIENELLRLRLFVFVFYWVNDFGIGVPCCIASLVLSPIWVGNSIASNGGDAALPIPTAIYTLSMTVL